MDTNELIAFAREQASVADQSTEWDSAKFLQLLNLARTDVFEPVITACRAGYWTHSLTRTLGANNPVVRLPPRAAAFMQADVRRNTDQWIPLQLSTEAEEQQWERESRDQPIAYIIRGSTMHLIKPPVDSSYSLRVKVVIRPSVLYLPQVGAGLVVSVDTATRIITVTSLPLDKATGLTIAGTLNIDCIETSDNYELSLFNASATVIDASHIQVASGYDLNRIAPGDAVRVANQSEWPQLPEPFHSSLATAAAITACPQRDLYDRANDLRQQTSSSVNRLAEHLRPRPMTRTEQRVPIQHSWT